MPTYPLKLVRESRPLSAQHPASHRGTRRVWLIENDTRVDMQLQCICYANHRRWLHMTTSSSLTYKVWKVVVFIQSKCCLVWRQWNKLNTNHLLMFAQKPKKGSVTIVGVKEFHISPNCNLLLTFLLSHNCKASKSSGISVMFLGVFI